MKKLEVFDFTPGSIFGGHYTVMNKLGSGWEGGSLQG